MKILLEHINQAEYTLLELFDHGFMHTRNMVSNVSKFSEISQELGFNKGSELLKSLADHIQAYNAGVCELNVLVKTYSNVWSYIQTIKRILYAKNAQHSMTKKDMEDKI